MLKVLVVGYHDCLVSPYSKDKKMHFSSHILQRIKNENYVGFIGTTPFSVKNAVLKHELICVEYRREFDENKPIHHIGHFNSDNLYVHQITSNLESVTRLKCLSVSSAEEKNCGDNFSELTRIEKSHSDNAHFKAEHTPVPKSKNSQIANIARFLRESFPHEAVEVDFIDVRKYALDIFQMTVEDIPQGITINVFVHENENKILHVGKISRDGILKKIKDYKPSHAANLFSSSKGDAYVEMADEEVQPKKSFFSCFPCC